MSENLDSITMDADDRALELEEKRKLEELVIYYKENCEDLIKMIEQVENKQKSFQCLVDIKDYIKKDLAPAK